MIMYISFNNISDIWLLKKLKVYLVLVDEILLLVVHFLLFLGHSEVTAVAFFDAYSSHG